MGNAIETKGLGKDYESFSLTDIDLVLPGGTILGLIGENGAGKSTLIKCLLGIVKPSRGTVTVLGDPTSDALSQVGYVPDECPFSDILQVGQVGKMLAGVFDTWDDGLWEDYTRQFELPWKKKVKELSRGMKMKLSIAAAFSHRPRLLVLDEATSGLDPVVRDEILDLLLDFIAYEDHAVLLSSHITSDLEKVCDYVTYLHKGKVTVSGAKDELLARYGKVACTQEELKRIQPPILVGARVGEYGCQAMVSDREALRRCLPGIIVEAPALEDIMIFTTRGDWA